MTEPVPLRAPAPRAGLRPGPVPRISVLIPAYNTAATVGEAVESALTQDPPPLEVIVSDDGSTDDLDAVLRPFGTNIRMVRGPNAGLAVARNRAASVARGDMLALLDADDVWLPGRTAALSRAAAARPDLAVLTTDAIVVRDGTPDRVTYYASREFYVDRQDLGIVQNSFIFGAAAVRTDVFRSVGGYRAGVRFAEDWDLWLRILLAGHAAGLIDLPLYEYRRRPDSLTAKRVDLALGVLAALQQNKALATAPEQRRQLRATIQRWRETAAREATSSGSPRAARLALRAAVGRPASARTRVRMTARAVLAGGRQAAGRLGNR